jgi:hypothetical protein
MNKITAASTLPNAASEAGPETGCPPSPNPVPPAEQPNTGRSCTCHPDEAPVPCQRKYVLSECLAAAKQPAPESTAIYGAHIEPLSSPTLALIERVVRDPSVDVEKLERILAMQERLLAKEAEQQFNGAKARIKKNLADVRIVKNRAVLYNIVKDHPEKGQAEAFKYAPLEEIHKHLAPLLTDEDMDLSYSDEPQPDGRISCRGRLKHLPSGHYEDSFMAGPMDTTGGKSNIQAVGSTNSYLRRYIACNIFNIVVVGDDDDGTGGTIDEGQVRYIRDLLKQCGRDEAGLAKYMRVSSIEEIPFRNYRKATSALEERIQKIAKARAEQQMQTGSSGSGLMGEP